MTYKGNPICLTADSSGETLLARMEWQDIFKVLKGKNLQPRLLYLERISFKIDGEIKSFFRQAKVKRIHVTGTYIVKKYKRKKKGYDKIFEEIIVENFPNMEKEIVNQV